jgi:PKD repeat protein
VTFSGAFTDPGALDTHTYAWDFGDGATATGTLTPTHTYMKAGTYTVTLTVTDDDTAVSVDTLTVTMTNRKLEARALLLASKTGQRDVDIVIDTAVSLIDKSLNKEYWIDDLHLVEKHGVKVFNYEALATASLEMSVKAYEKAIPQIQKMADLKTRQGKDASAELAKLAALKKAIPIFEQAAALLAQADEVLARVALEEAKALTPSRNGHDFSKHLANAEKELLSGQSEVAEGDYTKAILEYKHSWILSKQATHTHKGDNEWIRGIDQHDPDTGCGDDKKR